MRKREHTELWILSNHPALFAGMNDASRVVPFDGSCENFFRIWKRRCLGLEYNRYDPATDGSKAPARHIIAELCARAGITGPVRLRPYLNLDEAEKAEASWAKDCIVIQSSGLGAQYPMLNKEWFPARFQGIVNALRGAHKFVQLGSEVEPMLEDVIDLRSKTNIRQSAAILDQARMYIGVEGFLMHLARAVECPSVVIYGGRTAPWQTGYICNYNLYSALPCAPCWLWSTCDLDRKCMADITVTQVVEAAKDLLRKPRNPLMVETVEVD
jgi:hypothetical protein